MFAGIGLAVVDHAFPKFAARLAIEAEDGLRLPGFIGGGDIDAIADDGGRTVSAAGDRCFPKNIVGFAPLKRRALARRRDAVVCGSAPSGPVGGRIDRGGANPTGHAEERGDRADGKATEAEAKGVIWGNCVVLHQNSVNRPPAGCRAATRVSRNHSLTVVALFAGSRAATVRKRPSSSKS